jgi:hypothetical protein
MMSLHVIMTVLKKMKREGKGRRTGEPLQVYFKPEQRERLRRLAKDRRVAESELIRAAVDLLFARVSSGQLELGLEIDEN